MKPTDFPESNCVFAKDQSEYLPLPAHKTPDGVVITCWTLTWMERIKLLFVGRIWSSVLTFNQPLHPQRIDGESPFLTGKGGEE